MEDPFKNLVRKEKSTINLEMNQNKREQLLRSAINWVQERVAIVDNQLLEQAQVKIFSDERLEEDDIKFISTIKQSLDSDDKKAITIMILNSIHWETFMKLKGEDMEGIDFSGRSEENPIVPKDINQFLVLPSGDVFEKDTSYKQLYELSPKIKELFNKPEDLKAFYKAAYLRNILAHEIAHLYQFSQEEIEELLTLDSDAWQERFNRFLELREFLSCSFGLYHLKRFDNKAFTLFLDVCHKLAASGIGDDYAKEQARRHLDAADFIDSFPEDKIEKKFREVHAICQENIARKKDLQERVIKAREGAIPYTSLVESVG